MEVEHSAVNCMAYDIMSNDEADSLYSSTKHIDGYVISWERPEGNKQKLIVPLLWEDGNPLEVRGWYNLETGRYAFVLLYNKGTVIRRWDDSKGHLDPISNKILNGPHKHYYNTGYGESCPCSYETRDVRLGDADEALKDFLTECNISYDGVSFQQRL